MGTFKPMNLKIIDLFCGAGGLTEGFVHIAGGFTSVWANDFNEAATNTFNANFGEHCVYGDIVDILADPKTTIPRADVVIGGPPCQGFSLLNKNRANDLRKHLWQPYMEVVERSGADVFVMENVPQIIGSPEYDAIAAHAEQHGFRIAKKVLHAADFGVPQLRKRAFIIGSRFADPARVFPPQRTHIPLIESLKRNGNGFLPLDFGDDELPTWRTVKDAIGDLSEPKGTEVRADEEPPLNLQFGRTPTLLSQKRYRAIPEQGMNRFDLQRLAPELTPACWIRKTKGGTDLFGRLWWDRPSFTIRTEFFKPEKGRYLHPEQDRPITHREAARLQTFPDTFVFTGSKIEIAKQIGNAVPPRLAAQVARCVTALFELRENENLPLQASVRA